MSKRNVLAAIALGLVILLAVGCGQQASGPTAATTAAPAEVSLKSFAFAPKELTVTVGTTVTWKNEDSVAHTVTAGQRGSPSGLFDSGELAPGETFSFTFSQAGTYPYFCAAHANMDGTVIAK